MCCSAGLAAKKLLYYKFPYLCCTTFFCTYPSSASSYSAKNLSIIILITTDFLTPYFLAICSSSNCC
nr:MAG TPA: hypothetical protein [Caudoviricetes sp.]